MFMLMDGIVSCVIWFVAMIGFTSFASNAPRPDNSSGAYIDCFRDIGQYATFSNPSSETHLVPDSCRGRCRNESFTYIGLWGGYRCWCAVALYERTTPNRNTASSGILERTDDSHCNATCNGNSSLSCGGFTVENNTNIFSVYSVCPRSTYGSHCNHSCNCKDNSHCSFLGVCPNNECATGWKTGSKDNRLACNSDVNECKLKCNSTHSSNCHNCNSASNERCKNTNGSFECICERGYYNDSSGTCKDIDECKKNKHNCSHMCNNYEGGFNCSCRTGYQLEGFSDCTDVNECDDNTHRCHQTCHNTDGNYSCSCSNGFKLDADGFRCNDVDECATDTSICEHFCTNTYGGYQCSCRMGYELNNDNYTCKDINECQRNQTICDQMCNNTDGSYFCYCRSGFSLDQNRCNDVDECSVNNGNCNQTCNNTQGSYICSCKTGFRLHSDRHACEDIDECKENASRCVQQCINSFGSYECKCNEGYELQGDRHSCIDVDECSRNLSNCNQNCSNTIGNYSCSCFNGYSLNDSYTCFDINECETDNGGCQHYCNNTPGTFSCSCQPGYKSVNEVNETAKYNCTDIDECIEGSSNCAHDCINTVGSYNCSCHLGFELGNDTHSCEDIDECGIQTHQCEHRCKNRAGNYSCSCDGGYYLVGHFSCQKDYTSVILTVTILLLIILIIIMILFLLKMRHIFPFDKPRFGFLNGQKKRLETPHENGTNELKDLKEAKSHPNNRDKEKSLPTAATDHKELVLNTSVAVKDLKNYIEQIESRDGFEDEFRSIPMVSDFSYSQAQAQALKPKNRFKNILPYDHNRVILDEVNDDPLTTYINASFIKGYNKNDKIIASHGPTPNTLDDFWRMVWQYDVKVIVMVTKCMEDGKCKCEQYWPLQGSMDSGDLTITLDSTETRPDYVISRLKVSKENSSRLLIHLLFTDWPDHGAPEHATSLISFRRAARNVIVENKYFLVHCSAGVGRTGTFLAIDFLLQQAEAEGSIDVYKYLQSLRDQRMHAVQTTDQYQFIHHALLETLTLGKTTVPCSTLSDHRNYLEKINPMTGKSYFTTQFDMLQEIHPPLSKESTSVALDSDNISKNRNTRIVPGDTCRVYLSEASGDSDYINAVFVSSYRRKDAFISAELPLPETITNFWLMTLSYQCKLIVFLDSSSTSEDLNKYLLIPQKKKLSVNRHKFWTSSPEPKKISDHCDSYTIAVSAPIDDDEEIYANAEEIPAFKILILHFRLSTATTTSLLPQIHEQIKSSSENIKDNDPVVVVSRDGVNPSGQLIAVSNLLEMALAQNEVDVFNVVHCIKKSQPHFISSMDEYRTIFDAIVQVESDFATYANY